MGGISFRDRETGYICGNLASRMFMRFRESRCLTKIRIAPSRTSRRDVHARRYITDSSVDVRARREMLNTAASDAGSSCRGGVIGWAARVRIFRFFIVPSGITDASWRPSPRRAPAANNAPDAFPAPAHRPVLIPESDELSAFFCATACSRRRGIDRSRHPHLFRMARPNRFSAVLVACRPMMLPRDSQLSLPRKAPRRQVQTRPRVISADTTARQYPQLRGSYDREQNYSRSRHLECRP